MSHENEIEKAESGNVVSEKSHVAVREGKFSLRQRRARLRSGISPSREMVVWAVSEGCRWKDGGTSVEAYSATWGAERRMVAGHMRCLTPKIDRPLFKSRDFHQKKV